MPSFCAACGSSLGDDDARFCTHCGAAVAQAAPTAEQPTVVNGPVASTTTNGVLNHESGIATATAPPPVTTSTPAADPTPPPVAPPFAAPAPATEMPYAQSGTPPQAPVQPGPAYGAPPPQPPVYFGHPPQSEPPRGPSKGLIAGLAGALALVIAGIVVAVLLASSGSGTTPTVAAAQTPTASAATPANVTTVTKIIERTRTTATKRKRASSARVRTATPIVHHQATTSSFADKAEIRSVLQRHWSAIEAGNYAQAFALLVPGTQSESSWISSHEEDELTDESLSLGTPTLTSGTTATVPVDNLHTEAASGCFNWSGSYAMQKVGGDWRIGKASISRSAC